MNEKPPFPTPSMQPPLGQVPRRSGLRRFVFYLALLLVVAGALYFTVLRPYVAEYVAKYSVDVQACDYGDDIFSNTEKLRAQAEACAKTHQATVDKLLARGASDVSEAGDTVTTPCYSFTAPKGYKVSKAGADIAEDECTVYLDGPGLLSVRPFRDKPGDFAKGYKDTLTFFEDPSIGLVGQKRVTLNAYPTLVAYEALSRDMLEVTYTIDVVEQTIKTKGANKSVVVFYVDNSANTDEQDFAARLVAKSFKLVEGAAQ